MSDLIDRQAAIDAAAIPPEWDGMYIQDLNGRIREAIEQLPSAQPERIKGRWIPWAKGRVMCSICQKEPFNGKGADKLNYCPNCGAKMEVEHDTD